MSPRLSLVCLAFLAVAPTLAAQEVTPRSPQLREFVSPMVLDYTLGHLFQASAGINRQDLIYFSCRSVSLTRLNLGFVRDSKGKNTSLRVGLFINNNSGKDKKVTLLFDLRTEAASLGSGELRRLEVESGDSGMKVLSFPVTLPDEVLEPYPFLRITVEVSDT
jgi:hypothetical protein